MNIIMSKRNQSGWSALKQVSDLGLTLMSTVYLHQSICPFEEPVMSEAKQTLN